MLAYRGYGWGMTPRILVYLLALAALVAVVGGCAGDDGAEEYEQGLARVQRHLDDASEASRESGDATDVEVRREKLGEAHEAIAAAAREAESLDPPDDARDPHQRFTEALRDYADLFDRLARLDANDPGETELYSEAGEITKRLDEASRDLKEAGYEVNEDAS